MIRFSSRNTVHPHVCGEHQFDPSLVDHSGGSSPRVWGTRSNPILALINGRFIPTCVGNTKGPVAFTFGITVHPHVCGEHYVFLRFCVDFAGSSPRVWGTLTAWPSMPSLSRFIPTCVGNTNGEALWFVCSSVHPHVCGEHHNRGFQN